MASGFHPVGQSFELSTTTYTFASEPRVIAHIPTSINDAHMSEREIDPPRDAATEATTPIAAANPAPQPPSDDATTTNTADGGPTQRSLQQASLALEVALSRIVEVRRSLLQLAQSMPGGTPSDAPQESDEPDLNLRASAGVGPAHDAILLAGDAPSGGEQWGGSRPRRRHHPNARLRDSISDAIEPPYSPSPASDAVARLTQRYDDMYATLMSADPAATTRGLRVAAREAQVGAPPTRETFAPGSDFVLTPEYDEIRGVMSLGIRPPPPPPPPAPLPRAPLPPAWRTNETARWRRRALPMSLPPLPATSTGSGAGAGAEAPPRLPSFADFIGAPPPPVPGLGPFPEESAAARFAERYRQYQEARNAGDDDAALDWADDDFFAWLFPAPRMPLPLSLSTTEDASNAPGAGAGGSAVRVTRTTETQVSPADRPTGPGPARRRGWGTSPPRVRYADTALTPPAPAVRLDADGNEVPPDEEREIERVRTEHRIRAPGHARRGAPGGGAGAGGAAQAPASMRGSLHQFFGPSYEASRTAQPARRAEALPDDGADVDVEMQAVAATVVVRPLYVDPLPMPLAAMVADAQRPASPATRKAIVVPPHACLAGR